MNEYRVTIRWKFFDVVGSVTVTAPDETAAMNKADRMCSRPHEIIGVELTKEVVNGEKVPD